MAETEGHKVLARNREARARYEILETHEAGIALKGSEVKSIRKGAIQLRDAHARVTAGGQLVLVNCRVDPWPQASFDPPDPLRDRVLLMHRVEIRRLAGKIAEKGLALVPLSCYLADGHIKIELGLGKGRTFEDRREVIREREADQEARRAMSRRR